MSEKKSKQDASETYVYSNKIHWSYSLGSFFDDFGTTVLGTWYYIFYETEIGLSAILVSLAIVIYGIWNAVNDPIAGYISDFPFKFTRKRGKRFTWFLISAIPCAIVFIFIFTPPIGNDFIVFIWLLIFLCLFDTLFSFMMINWQAIYPDKYRSHEERTRVGAIQTILSNFGLVFGIIIPWIIITSGPPGTNAVSYFSMAVVTTIILIIVTVLMIPGTREDQELINKPFQVDQQKEKQKSFTETFKFAVKEKNFMAYLVAYLAQVTVMVIMLASLPYWVRFVLVADPILEYLLFVPFLLAGILSVPFWIRISRKYGNRIGYMCGTGLTAIFLIFTLIPFDIYGSFVCMTLIGFSMGATWSLMYPTFSDVIDEIVVKTGYREEGLYYGLRRLFSRLSIVIQALTFGIIHPLTNFNPDSLTQSIPAQWGRMIGMLAIPAFFYMLGFLCMWKIYDLKPKKVQTIKDKLKELDL